MDFGLTDSWIIRRYVGSFLCVAFCVVHGFLREKKRKTMSNGVNLTVFGVMTGVFLVITFMLKWYSCKNTCGNEEFLLGHNEPGSVIIAPLLRGHVLSASAVIGFGGQTAIHGMSVMWLCLLNLFVGLIIAFLVFGRPTCKKGRELGASMYADLFGKVYKSKGIRTFTAPLVIVMMLTYAATTLNGGVNLLVVVTGLTEYTITL